MNRSLIPALAVVAVVACAESAPEPMSPADEAASSAAAASWAAAEITRDLPVDEATRQELTAALDELRPSILELQRQHEAAGTLEGDRREAVLARLHEDAMSLHERHTDLLASLDPAVAQELMVRVHEKMRADHDGMDHGTLHERMRRLHGVGDHRAPHSAD